MCNVGDVTYINLDVPGDADVATCDDEDEPDTDHEEVSDDDLVSSDDG